jgi:hypothetical protein
MALRLGALHDALLEAGATPPTAQKASEEVANYEHRLAGIETKLAVLTWMVGTNVAISLALLWKVFSL